MRSWSLLPPADQVPGPGAANDDPLDAMIRELAVEDAELLATLKGPALERHKKRIEESAAKRAAMEAEWAGEDAENAAADAALQAEWDDTDRMVREWEAGSRQHAADMAEVRGLEKAYWIREAARQKGQTGDGEP